jgi:hypothetical protein
MTNRRYEQSERRGHNGNAQLALVPVVSEIFSELELCETSHTKYCARAIQPEKPNMTDEEAKQRAKEIEQEMIDAGELIVLGRNRCISAKEFFALPLEKQIELKRSVSRVTRDHWRKGQPKP